MEEFLFKAKSHDIIDASAHAKHGSISYMVNSSYKIITKLFYIGSRDLSAPLLGQS